VTYGSCRKAGSYGETVTLAPSREAARRVVVEHLGALTGRRLGESTLAFPDPDAHAGVQFPRHHEVPVSGGERIHLRDRGRQPSGAGNVVAATSRVKIKRRPLLVGGVTVLPNSTIFRDFQTRGFSMSVPILLAYGRGFTCTRRCGRELPVPCRGPCTIVVMAGIIFGIIAPPDRV